MFYFDSLSFSSIRFLSLISHLLLTFFLLWSKYDPLLVTLKPDYTTQDYSKIEDRFTGLIGFGIASLILEVIMILLVPYQISFFNAIKLLLDIVGSFFICWIVLDGLSWKTYIYILVFCVVIPTYGDIFKYFMFLKKNVWVNWRNTQSIFEILNKIPEAIFKIIYATIKCVISIHLFMISCLFPPVVERDEPTLYERFCGRLICFDIFGQCVSDPFSFLNGCFEFCSNPSTWCEYFPTFPSEVSECLVATYEGLTMFVTMIGAACGWLYTSIRECWSYTAPRMYDCFIFVIRQIRLFFR